MEKTNNDYKIAVLFEGNIEKIRGEFTAIHNRVKELKKISSYVVDVFIFDTYFDNVTCFLKRITPKKRPKSFFFDGINYKCYWYKRSFIDYVYRIYVKNSTSIEINRVCKYMNMFNEYDLLYTNSLKTGVLAYRLKKSLNIPFISLWHGSSIHTFPFKYKHIRKQTIKVLENANINLFVSDELYELAKNLTDNFKGQVSYNGIDTTVFKKYSIEEKVDLRKNYGINVEDKCVAFVGNCLPEKNVAYLPELFTELFKHIPKVSFYILGRGDFSTLFDKCEFTIRNMEVLNTEMPLWYNCMDLIVMPSHKEGLPMTCLEATACGTPFVGSRVGAIADVVGEQNTISHTDEFNKQFAKLCIQRLLERQDIILPSAFLLNFIVKKEKELIDSLLTK